jgi:hypothetical protein
MRFKAVASKYNHLIVGLWPGVINIKFINRTFTRFCLTRIFQNFEKKPLHVHKNA